MAEMKVFRKSENSAIVQIILDLFIKLPYQHRHMLVPLLKLHKKQLRLLLIDMDIDDEKKLVLSSYIGIPSVCIALGILDLSPERRIRVIPEIIECKKVIKSLPWKEWLERDPEQYATLAAEAATRHKLTETLPSLQKAASSYPFPRVLQAIDFLENLQRPCLDKKQNTEKYDNYALNSYRSNI